MKRSKDLPPANSIARYFQVLPKIIEEVTVEEVGAYSPKKQRISIPLAVSEPESMDSANFGNAVLDIGNAIIGIGLPSLTPEEKVQFLENSWKPAEDYEFPKNSANGRRFLHKYLKTYPWMSYSPKLLLCRYCVLFAKPASAVSLGVFSKQPQTKLKDIIADSNAHEGCKYHAVAMETAQNVSDFVNGRRDSINVVLDDHKKQRQIVKERGALSVARAVLVCGRQGLAFRGASDNYVIDPTTDYYAPRSQRYGNFNSLLFLQCASGDSDLIKHMGTGSKNAKWTTSDPQNEMICIAGRLIQQKILDRVRQARWFSIMGDGTTDIHKLDQFCLILRYFLDGYLHKDFLDYMVVSGATTGKNLADLILKWIVDVGLDPKKMRGQGYDGASNMTGSEKGCKTLILNQFPKALFTHCGAHNLNLGLSDACEIVEMAKMFATVQAVTTFFISSAKRTEALDKNVPVAQKERRLKLLCPTRWASRLVSLNAMANMIVPVAETLDSMHSDGDPKTKTKAVSLSEALDSIQFLVALWIGKRYLGVTGVLSKQLQTRHLDYARAMEEVHIIISLLEDDLADFTDVFSKLYYEAVVVAGKLSIEVTMPRRPAGRSVYRSNFQTDDPEEYYRETVGKPFVEHLLSSLKERFSASVERAFKTAQLLPRFVVETTSDFLDLVETYADDLPKPDGFDVELIRWKKYWENKPEVDRPKTIMGAIAKCDGDYYPNIRILLIIFAVLPVSVAECERSFSTLKRLKTYLRSLTGQERLVGLALLNIHLEVEVTPEELAKAFMSVASRRV